MSPSLMRAVVGDRLGVKASGGIRSQEDAEGDDRRRRRPNPGPPASVAIVAGD